MTIYPDPGTPVRITAQLGKAQPHVVLGFVVEYDDEKLTIRPAGSQTTVWFDTNAVTEVEPIELSDMEHTVRVERLDHPLPETIREHMVRWHGYTIHSVAGSSVESLLDHHDRVLHAEGQHLSHIHGLTMRERELVDEIRSRGV